MSYQALYRQWRPIDFDEIIGQKHIIEPLKNQVNHQNFGHAYIFSGTRGTGKTSTAKVFARAVNCLNNVGGNPCNECENCKSILEDQFIDVIEMDAASNNSVDDIRELREHVKFSPSRGKFKVYIIDEVHMLSSGAFNALLKTLEEPPSYVLFILATTEPHKIPQTIMSRCQKYDFKRVSYEDLLVRLKYICKKMSVEYEESALKLIIEKSDGAVRDSISQLDQCLTLKQGSLKTLDVIELLGLVEKNIILDLIHYIAMEKGNEALTLIDRIVKNGKDISQLINNIIEVYRDLLVCKIANDNYQILIEASTEYIETILLLCNQLTEGQIHYGLKAFIDLSKNIKYSQNKRILIESTIISLMHPENKTNYEDLVYRIETLEKKVASMEVGDSLSINHTPSKLTKVTSSKSKNEPIKNEDEIDHISQEEPTFIEFSDKMVTIDDIMEEWQSFLKKVQAEKKGIYPALEGSEPVFVDNNCVTVYLKPEQQLFIALLTSPQNLKYLTILLSDLAGASLKLKFDIKAKEETDNEAQLKDFFKDFDDILEIK